MKEKSMRKGLLCFGGSFNPIHNAHLECCRNVAKLRKSARVLLIPTAVSPHKIGHSDMASATDRLTMCRIAAEGDSLFEVSDIELHRKGPSFTIDTVHELQRSGQGPIEWLIGADMLAILPKWHRATELIRDAQILIMARPGFEIRWNDLPEEFRFLKSNVVPAPLIDISATEIRRRVAAGESIADVVPPGVASYIRERGLYR